MTTLQLNWQNAWREFSNLTALPDSLLPLVAQMRQPDLTLEQEAVFIGLDASNR